MFTTQELHQVGWLTEPHALEEFRVDEGYRVPKKKALSLLLQDSVGPTAGGAGTCEAQRASTFTVP